MAEIQSATTSSTDSTKRRQQRRPAEVNIPLWDRVLRIIFGRIPKNMNTVLVLFTVQIQMTVPFFLLANFSFNLRSLLRPFRIIHQMGFDFEELNDRYRPLL
ncbi:hypothetical protein M3Y97_00579200 [Aphelenchoides bicaudatus]|nr:hypothetical protein M3Y97_00579200 [Aphelenchoides bicaudatus]